MGWLKNMRKAIAEGRAADWYSGDDDCYDMLSVCRGGAADIAAEFEAGLGEPEHIDAALYRGLYAITPAARDAIVASIEANGISDGAPVSTSTNRVVAEGFAPRATCVMLVINYTGPAWSIRREAKGRCDEEEMLLPSRVKSYVTGKHIDRHGRVVIFVRAEA